MPDVTLAAPAKINLFLSVRGRRPDGYHELDSVMVKLGLADRLRFRLAPVDRLTIAAGPGLRLEEGFEGPDNLLWKALALFRSRTGFPRTGLSIALIKNIPLAAGLGGGSTDAAAALMALNELGGRPLRREALLELGLALGADVPFFLYPGAMARARGVGEILSPPPAAWSGLAGRPAVLLNPGFRLSTAEVFQNLELTKSPAEYNLGPGLSALAQNDLLSSALKLRPDIENAVNALRHCGAEIFGLSGSGPTFWALPPLGGRINLPSCPDWWIRETVLAPEADTLNC